LDDAAKDAALALVLDFVRSCARSMHHARRERARESPHQWWEREGPALQRLGVAQRYPLASRIGAAAGEAHGAAQDAKAHYMFGLEVILRGIDAEGRRDNAFPE
jgi:hypothetical protein